MRKSVKEILDLLDTSGIDCVTFNAYNFEEEWGISSDDKDWVTFHKSTLPPVIADKLLVCDYETTSEPIYNGWYMTINYHS